MTDNKIRIVYIVESMLGGIRRHVIDIIENLDPEKYEIYLIYSDRRADKAFFEEKTELEKHAELILCNEMQRELGLHDFTAYKALVKHIRILAPDIVHCHSSKAGIVGRMAAKRCGVKKNIYTPHAYAFETPELSKLKRKIYIWAERFLSRHATTMTINVSKGEMQEALRNKLNREDKFTLIYNGIPDIKIPSKAELRKRLGLEENGYCVGVTARCAKQKDPMTFLKIAEQVIQSRSDVKFVYIGDGEMMEEMKAFVNSHGLQDKILLLGFRSDAGEVVGAFDIYLSTALYEGMPYSMIEAMRAGVPIIATDVVGNRELVIAGENGQLFDVGNVEEAKDLILKQIDNKKIDSQSVCMSYEKKYMLKNMVFELRRAYRR